MDQAKIAEASVGDAMFLKKRVLKKGNDSRVSLAMVRYFCTVGLRKGQDLKMWRRSPGY